MNRARGRLEVERQQTMRRLASLRQDFDAVVAASRDTNADDEHDPEGATIAFERSQVGALLRQAERGLDAIDAALRSGRQWNVRILRGLWKSYRQGTLGSPARSTDLHPVRLWLTPTRRARTAAPRTARPVPHG